MVAANVVYDDYVLPLELRGKSREEFRKAVVNTFLLEKGGYWAGNLKHVTRYKYFVESLGDERRIFLFRPTYLNKGIDFQVWVERFIDDEDKKPSHKDMLHDLSAKKKENPKDFQKLMKAIGRVWNCEEPDAILKEFSGLRFSVGFQVELILKVLKWLFIEQDITYWNYDGRGMLKQAIDGI